MWRRTAAAAAALLVIAAFALLSRSSGRGSSLSERTVLRVENGREIRFSQMTTELADADAVFIGEIHDVREHHRIQLEVIGALHEADVPIAVGLEMFQTEHQAGLNEWTAGRMNEAVFRRLYETNWTLPWDLYADIFRYVRDHDIPLLALNLPDGVTQKVARSGFSSLSTNELRKLPPGIACDIDDSYMAFIRRSHGMHGHGGRSFRYFCEAQMVWDGVMAKRVAEYLAREQGRTVLVLAGSGHAWRRGVPARLAIYAPTVRSLVVMPQIPLKAERGNVTTDDADYVVL
jgi:uncharacterized iron-regulated protein